MITIVDYRAGNLASVRKGFAHLGYETEITEDPAVVAKATRVVLPGVGHFSAVAQLERAGLKQAIAEVIARGVPFLGICVGMQWMFEGSTEAPEVAGLGVLPGCCAKFPATVKSPHVGWNSVKAGAPSRQLAGLPAEFFVYYTHSYRAPVTDATVACTEYGGSFAAVVERSNLFGVQGHPEKSSEAGLRMLDNFGRLPC